MKDCLLSGFALEESCLALRNKTNQGGLNFGVDDIRQWLCIAPSQGN